MAPPPRKPPPDEEPNPLYKQIVYLAKAADLSPRKLSIKAKLDESFISKLGQRGANASIRADPRDARRRPANGDAGYRRDRIGNPSERRDGRRHAGVRRLEKRRLRHNIPRPADILAVALMVEQDGDASRPPHGAPSRPRI